MPNLADLTDYDPMGNVTGVAPEADGVRRVYIGDTVPEGKPEGKPSLVDGIVNKLLGLNGEERYQLWPEKVVREGLSAAGDVLAGKTPQWQVDPVTGDVHTSSQMIEGAQAMSALAGSGGLAGTTDATLGATPFLRPALKYKDRLYKGKEGQAHQDVIPDALYPEFQKMAMSGDDISHYNFGFHNDKGQFLSREAALEYGINTGLIDPQAGKFGALTSTLLADSSKPGMAIEATAKANQPTFFSALEHNVSKIAQDKMTGDQWLGTLANKPGVKPEELQWSGLKDYLEQNKGKPVTKAQIEQHLAENKTELGEVVKGSSENSRKLAYDNLEKQIGNGLEIKGEKWYSDEISRALLDGDLKPTDLPKTMQEQAANLIAAEKDYQANYNPVKYKSYQVPGGENYREVLMTLPTKDGFDPKNVKIERSQQSTTQGSAKIYYGDKEVGRFDDPPMYNAATKRYEQRPDDYWHGVVQRRFDGDKSLGIKPLSSNYKSSHWDEPNILAHMRMNDRTIDGKKSLHLEEVQSDWHQDGRKKGYKSEEAVKEYSNMLDEKHELAKKVVAIENNLKAELGKGYDIHNLTDAEKQSLTEKLRTAKANSKEYQEANKAYTTVADKVDKGNPNMGVPDAPFKKNWHELALKRAIREAAENDYDRLSWTAGEHHPTNPKNLQQRGPEADAADKGMQGFYNNMLPKSVEKLTGQKVKEGKIELPGKNKDMTADRAAEMMADDPRWKVPKDPAKREEWVDNLSTSERNRLYQAAYEKEGLKDNKKIYYIDIPQSVKDTALGKGFPLYSSSHMFTPVVGNPFNTENKK